MGGAGRYFQNSAVVSPHLDQKQAWAVLAVHSAFYLYFFGWKEAYMFIDANHISNPKNR